MLQVAWDHVSAHRSTFVLYNTPIQYPCPECNILRARLDTLNSLLILFVPEKNNGKKSWKHCFNDTVAVDIIMTQIKVMIMFILLLVYPKISELSNNSKHTHTQSQRA